MKVNKNSLRKKFRELRSSLSIREREEKNKKITKRLFSLKEFKRAKTIMFYVAFDSEVKTEEMIETTLNSGKKVVIPFVIDKKEKMGVSEIRKDYKKHLKKGAFGIMEKKGPFIKGFNSSSIEMVVVPGIAFDKQGRRIGFGYGYYDRFLKNLRRETPLVGLAYELQMAERVSNNLKYDVSMDLVVTEKRVIRVKKDYIN